MYAQSGLDPGLVEAWGSSGAAAAEASQQLNSAWSETQTANLADKPYELEADNKFASEEDPFARGVELFKAGNLSVRCRHHGAFAEWHDGLGMDLFVVMEEAEKEEEGSRR